MTAIERMPVRSRPGFDCRRDHANCPACKAQSENDHGISGGIAWYAVSADHDGRRVALVLEVLRRDWLPVTRAALRGEDDERFVNRPPMGATLSLHYSDGTEHDCDWFGDGGKCRCEMIGYLDADQFYKQWGNADPNAAADAQSEEFWAALELQLQFWLAREPVVS